MAIPTKSRPQLVVRAKKHYDPHEFVFPPTDGKGNSAEARFRMAPATAEKVQLVMESRRYPYRTHADFHRHAAELLLKVLHELEPELSTAKTAVLDMALAHTREQARIEHVYSVADEIAATLADTAKRSTADAALRIVELKSIAQHLPEAVRSRLYECLTARLGPLMASAVVDFRATVRAARAEGIGQTVIGADGEIYQGDGDGPEDGGKAGGDD